MSKKYNPLTDWNYDAKIRHTWKNPFDGEEVLSGYLFWEMSKVPSPNQFDQKKKKH
jgi:hypothetical protein